MHLLVQKKFVIKSEMLLIKMGKRDKQTFSVWFCASFYKPDGVLDELTSRLDKLHDLIHVVFGAEVEEMCKRQCFCPSFQTGNGGTEKQTVDKQTDSEREDRERGQGYRKRGHREDRGTERENRQTWREREDRETGHREREDRQTGRERSEAETDR